MDTRFLRTLGCCNEDDAKEKYWETSTDCYSTSTHTGRNRSNIKFNNVDISQGSYKPASHPYFSTLSKEQSEDHCKLEMKTKITQITVTNLTIIRIMKNGKLTL